MTQNRRRGLSASEKKELWDRWKRGQSSNDIARALAKHRGSIRFVLSSSGGIEPATRRRSRRALSLSEREEISRGLAEGHSMREIQSPWQRGTNENTNRLLRQYFPKDTDLSACSQADLNRIALRLNQRPRKTLAFRSPAEVLDESVALTG